MGVGRCARESVARGGEKGRSGGVCGRCQGMCAVHLPPFAQPLLWLLTHSISSHAPASEVYRCTISAFLVERW